jgi:dTDP-4-dehydrorhamnose reductase
MRVTVFGATGMLGKALARHSIAAEWSGFGSKDADIRDSAAVAGAIERTRPGWIILAAAYTDVDGCETNSQLAYDVNCQGAVNVAQAAQAVGCKLLFLSTDYVFDGEGNTPYETSSATNPQSVYGKTKAQAEFELTRIMPEVCIVRTSWLYGLGGKCFPDTILQLARTRPEIQVVDDQRGSPTHTSDLARAIFELCRRGAKGIVHATSRGDCTWFEFAQEIMRRRGLNTVVRPTTSEQFARPARRPKYSVLSLRSLEDYGIAMPVWREALGEYLAERP